MDQSFIAGLKLVIVVASALLFWPNAPLAAAGSYLIESEKLIAADGAASDHYGQSVAIAGDTAVVGAPRHKVGSNTQQGAAYVMERNTGGANKWGLIKQLIASDGHIPEETRRSTSGINYTQEALDYKIAVAVLAQRRGIDLWSYGRFKLAVDYVAPYVLNPSAWPWASGATATIHPLWEVAYQHWSSAAYKPIITKRRPYGVDGHSAVRWTTLTNGIPFK